METSRIEYAVGVVLAFLIVGGVVAAFFWVFAWITQPLRDSYARERAVHDHACLSRNMQPVAGIYGSGKSSKYFRVCVAPDGAVYMFALPVEN